MNASLGTGTGWVYNTAAPTLNAHDQARLLEMSLNAASLRYEIIKKLFDPRRDLNDECGYPSDHTGIGADRYQDLYDREPIAARVVGLLPSECWQVQPLVYEDEDSETITAFEEAWDALGASLRGEQSHYREEEGSPIWEYLRRADELSRVGHYGVILLGLDDGLDLSQPAKGVEETNTSPVEKDQSQPTGSWGAYPKGPPQGTYNLTVNLEETPRPDGTTRKGNALKFLRAFPESLAQVSGWETNPTSPRFGQPTSYLLSFSDPRSTLIGTGVPLVSRTVHWTRVIHVADVHHQASTSEIVAVPALRPVLNPVLDVQKVRSASAEGYYRLGFPGLSLETHPQLGGQVDVDWAKTRDELEQYMNGMQRYMINAGMAAKTLAPGVTDPTPWIEAIINVICIQLGCPARIFKGSERGELASSQDERAWRDRVRFRQHNYLTPRVIVPFIDRLIMLGCLPAPAKKGGKLNVKEGPKPGELPETESEAPENGKPEGGAPSFPPKKPAFSTNAFPPRPFGKPANGEPPAVPGQRPLPFPPKADEEEESDALDEGSVPEAPGGYRIEWPDVSSQSDTEKADIAVKRMQAAGAYVQGGVSALIPELDFLTRILGFTEEEAKSMLENASAAEEDRLAEEQLMADEHGFEPTPPEGFTDPEAEKQKLEIEKERAKNGLPPGGGFGGKGGPPGGGKPFPPKKPAANAFCPTGAGGGVDPSCAPEGTSRASGGTPRAQAKDLLRAVRRATDGEDTRDYYRNMQHDAPTREKLTALADDAETKLRKVSVSAEEKAAAFQTLANESRRIVARMHRWQRGTGLPDSQSGLVVQMQLLRDGARLAEKKAETIRAFGKQPQR